MRFSQEATRQGPISLWGTYSIGPGPGSDGGEDPPPEEPPPEPDVPPLLEESLVFLTLTQMATAVAPKGVYPHAPQVSLYLTLCFSPSISHEESDFA